MNHETPQAQQSPWVPEVIEGESPYLGEVRAVAKKLWGEGIDARLLTIGIVLGRDVFLDEVINSRELCFALSVDDPDEAFSCLLDYGSGDGRREKPDLRIVS
ncbi:MAG TPA: hypothetical protein VMR18_00350 [Candidatus Saccharimonadales bacterium]|nr:hypothetical protein [Candidatus Saccharimonadales bacterium]